MTRQFESANNLTIKAKIAKVAKRAAAILASSVIEAGLQAQEIVGRNVQPVALAILDSATVTVRQGAEKVNQVVAVWQPYQEILGVVLAAAQSADQLV